VLRKNVATQRKREAELLKNGYPAYTTSIGWISYSDEKVKAKCRDALGEGFTRFKMKVGQDAQEMFEEVRWYEMKLAMTLC